MKKWLLTIVFLCSICCTNAFAYGYEPKAQSQSWGYQPTYTSTLSAPSYQFYSTSSYISSVRGVQAGSLSLGSAGPLRTSSSPWDWTDDENPIGEVEDFDGPIGDIPWCLMMLLAAGYVALRSLRQRKA